MTVDDRWRAVREIERGLPNPTFIISLEVPLRGLRGGVVCESAALDAAWRIFENTHRLATDKEIAEYHRLQARMHGKIRAEEHIFRNRLVVTLPAGPPNEPEKRGR